MKNAATSQCQKGRKNGTANGWASLKKKGQIDTQSTIEPTDLHARFIVRIERFDRLQVAVASYKKSAFHGILKEEPLEVIFMPKRFLMIISPDFIAYVEAWTDASVSNPPNTLSVYIRLPRHLCTAPS